MSEKQIPTLEQSMATMVDAIHGIAQGERLARPKIGIVLTPPPALKV